MTTQPEEPGPSALPAAGPDATPATPSASSSKNNDFWLGVLLQLGALGVSYTVMLGLSSVAYGEPFRLWLEYAPPIAFLALNVIAIVLALLRRRWLGVGMLSVWGFVLAIGLLIALCLAVTCGSMLQNI